MVSNPILNIPITLISGSTTANLIASWVLTLKTISKDGDFAVLQKNVGEQPAGLYIYLNNRWNFLVPYEPVSQYVVPGGNITVYINLQVPVTVNQDLIVYRNSILTNVTILTPEQNTIWATILPESSEFQYELPIATSTRLGGVKIGEGVSATNDGTLSADVKTVAGRTGDVVLAVTDVSGAAPLASPAFTGIPTVPTAPLGTDTEQVASTAFVMEALGQGGGYTLPVATTTTLGGVKQGDTVTIDQTGILNVNYNNYSLIKWVGSTSGKDSNPGTYEQPWATIQHAKDNIQVGTTLYVSAGSYSDVLVWNNPHNIIFTGVGDVEFTGLFSLVTSSQSTFVFNNINFQGGLTLQFTATVKVIFNNCKISGTFTNNATGYLEMNDCDLSDVVFTKGFATVICTRCKIGDININNPNNYCLIQDCKGYIEPVTNGITATAGTLIISNSLIKNINNVTQLLVTTNPSTLNLSNVQIYNANNTPASIAVHGLYSINSCIFDKNSDFSGSTPVPNNSSYVNSLTVLGGLIKPAYPYGIAADLTGTPVNAFSVGEYKDQFVSQMPITTAKAYQSVNQMFLPPGEWDVSAFGIPLYDGEADFTNFGLYFTTVPDGIWPYIDLTPAVRVSSNPFVEAPILSMPVVRLASAVDFTVILWGMTDWSGTPSSVYIQSLIRARRI
jgi:hypothetical protein